VALAGWSSNNKYSLMGAIRSSAQMISYELAMGLALIAVVIVSGTLGLHQIVEQQHVNGWNVVRTPTMFIAFLIFFIAGIAETNRAPFDMAEAETELVAGFHTEYSSFKFAMFFMAEYVNMVMISALSVTLFLGGWSGPGINFDPTTGTLAGGWPFALLGVAYFVAKTFFFLFVYMWIRASMPRFRYDQLMNFGWKRLLPISLANIAFVALYLAWSRGWFNTGA
jgi:NADH-quinone oxidoreductase subunit H